MAAKAFLSSVAAFGLAQNAIADNPSCPANAPLSCHNTTVIENTCCTEVQGQVLQVQFWDTDPATGPADSWTIHGLWPDFCDGTYTQYCDESRQYTNISCILEAAGTEGQDILSFMEQYWKDDAGNDESFWEHEWGKHGTCYSTLAQSCFSDYQPFEEVVAFFNTTTTLFKTLPTYDYLSAAGITPSSTKSYTYNEVMAALTDARGVNATLSCEDGALYQIEYTFSVQGSVADGTFVPAEPIGEGTTGCPSTFKYLPKNTATAPKVSPTTCPAVKATAV